MIPHCRANERTDSPFWQHCANIELPDSLARKLAMFRSNGQIFRESEELFTEVGWLQVMLALGIEPTRHHHQPDRRFPGPYPHPDQPAVDTFPAHDSFVAEHGRAGSAA